MSFKSVLSLAALTLSASTVLGCAGTETVPVADRPSTVRIEPLPDGSLGVSLLGEALVNDPSTSGPAYENMVAARDRYEANPDDVEAYIWYGRRLAYTGRYIDAINAYSEGMEHFPDDPRLYRHRGHRFLTLRMLDRAIEDFEYAAELFEGEEDVIEPDGNPNVRNTPISSLQGNTWYHLALSHYLKGDFEKSLDAWQESLKVSVNPDMLVATTNWLYMTLRRMGRDAEAEAVLEPITADLDVFENMAYHVLTLFYKGEMSIDDLQAEEDGLLAYMFAGTQYGIGNWYYYNGDVESAREIFQAIVDQPGWGSFAAIAAEADLSRMNGVD